MRKQSLQFVTADDAPAEKPGKRLVKTGVRVQTVAPMAPRNAVKAGSLPDLVEDWVLDGQTGAKRRRTTKATSANREILLGRLVRFIRERKYPTCGPRECREFLAMIADQGGSPATERTYHAYIASFFGWLVKIHQLDESPMRHIERNEERPRPRQPLDAIQMEQLKAAADASSNRERDLAIVVFLWDSGLRVSEMCPLKMEDVVIRGGRMSGIVHGKGGKWRAWYAGGDAAGLVRAYLRVRYRDAQDRYDEERIRPTDPLFASTGRWAGRPLTPAGVRQILERAVERAAERWNVNIRASPHILRHTFTRDIFRKGADVRGAQMLLGHEDPRQTLHYGKMLSHDVADLHARVSPADNARDRRLK